MEKIKEFMSDHLTDLIAISAGVFFVLGCWCLYTANRTVNDYHDVHESVDRAEAGIDRAESGARTAQTEIKNAEVHIQRANEATGKLTERTKRDAEELDECQHLADRMSERSERIQRIIANVESANKTDGAQTNCNT
ncbi:MAG: hypothetical protein DBY44_00025 [Veillonellaceae bacterium]|nr:MAG: hypothetical protein DBY44_00025 [Veillonellaceae bacterium]